MFSIGSILRDVSENVSLVIIVVVHICVHFCEYVCMVTLLEAFRIVDSMACWVCSCHRCFISLHVHTLVDVENRTVEKQFKWNGDVLECKMNSGWFCYESGDW